MFKIERDDRWVTITVATPNGSALVVIRDAEFRAALKAVA